MHPHDFTEAGSNTIWLHCQTDKEIVCLRNTPEKAINYQVEVIPDLAHHVGVQAQMPEEQECTPRAGKR